MALVLWAAVKWKPNTRHKTHSSQKLATLLLCIDTASCRVGDVHSENSQVHTVVSLLLWRWALCKVCSSSIANGGRQRRAERCGFLVAEGASTRHKVKTPCNVSGGIVLLYYKARLHTANLVRDKLHRFGWETLQYSPPYSTDLSPCDLHIFGDLKIDIRGRRFHSDEEVQEWVRLWIHQRPTSFYKSSPMVQWLSYSPLDPSFAVSIPAGFDGFFFFRA